MKDLLREDGGLTYLFDLLSSSRVEQIRNATMFCIGCALERNGITKSCLLLLFRLAQFSNLCNVTCFVIMFSVKINKCHCTRILHLVTLLSVFNQKHFSELDKFLLLESVISGHNPSLAALQSCTFLLMQTVANNGLYLLDIVDLALVS